MGIFIIGDGEEHGFESISNMENNFLQLKKNLLPKIQKDILACEEKFKDSRKDSGYQIEGAYGGRAFYTIKDNKVQKYEKVINKIITEFYAHIEKELAIGAEAKELGVMFDTINQRKKMVTKAILRKIHGHQMNKLIREYNNGKDKYKSTPIVIGNICRGEETYISHIFKPSLDMNIVARVGGCSGRGENIRDICISKDIFSPANEELFDTLKNNDQ
ncbi:MAG: hypothetical protein NTY80_03475 [candidate division SR1 bacterium]|nr:hypothetical protein [candidate division SR1 bacterium]